MIEPYELKLIKQLKLHPEENLSITDFLYILDYLLRQSPIMPIQYIKRYIQDSYPHNQIEWKQIQNQELLQMYHDSIQYYNKNSQKWIKQDNKLLQIELQQFEEKKRIKKILKEKGITKEELIDIYLEEIRRNKVVVAKNNVNNTGIKSISSSQELLQKDKSNSNEIISNSQKQKYMQNIEILTNRINLMRKTPKFDSQSLEQPTIKRSYKQKYLIREAQLKQLAKNYFYFKKKYFQDHQKNIQRYELSELKNKLQKKKKYLSKRLKQIFLHYSSENYDPALSFQKNNTKLEKMDLRLFLKFIKELKEANRVEEKTVANNNSLNIVKNSKNQQDIKSNIKTQKESKKLSKQQNLKIKNADANQSAKTHSQVLKTNSKNYLAQLLQTNQKKYLAQNLISIFKKYGLNQKQINFQQFQIINYNLFFRSQDIVEENSSQKLNKSSQDLVNKSKDSDKKQQNKPTNPSRQLSTKQQARLKSHIQQQLLMIDKLKHIYFNQNINKLLNISNSSSKYKYSPFNKVSNKNNPQENSLNRKQTIIGNMIDKSLNDYQRTKNQIHQNILKNKRGIWFNRQIKSVINQQQQLSDINLVTNSTKSSDDNSKTNFFKLKKKSNSLQKLKSKVLERQEIKIPITITNSRISSKSAMSTYEVPKSKNRSQTPLNKHIFNEIIEQANVESEDEENQGKINSVKKLQLNTRRSKSTDNILHIKPHSQASLYKKNPQQQQSKHIVTLSQLSKRQPKQSFQGYKQIFTLPRITRISKQSIQNQSIIKSLNYLYQKLGKKQQPRIKKILDIDNVNVQRNNQIENNFLKQHFGNQIKDQKTVEEEIKEKRRQMVMLSEEKKCKKYKEDNYQKFMKFS